MKSKAYLLVFDSMADWEPALATAEINRSEKPVEVITAGFTREPVTTLGGLTLIPQVTLEEILPEQTAILILPGGDRWEQTVEEELLALLRQLHAQGVLIAAICGATLAVGKAGLLDNTRHTSNARFYLKHFLPHYRGENFYVEELAVADNNLITASGLGYVEFAREIFKHLELYGEEDLALWYTMFKQGVMPEAIAAAYEAQLRHQE